MDPKNKAKADSPASLLDRAITLHQGGDVAGAIPLYRAFLAARPQDVQASHLLGLALWQAGEQAEGLARVAAAAEKAPDSPAIQNNHGGLLKAMGRHREAERAFRRALAAKADFADAWSNLAAVLVDLGRPSDAVAAGRRATTLAPAKADGWSNLGVALLETGRAGEAEQCQRRAIALAPGLAVAHANLGTLLRRTGQKQAAVECFDAAIRLDPAQPVARLNLGLDHLAHGRLTIGWDFYADRFRAGHRQPAAPLPLPPWRGEPLAGRRLLIRPEQGLGDEIMFAAAVPDPARLGGEIILELDARLVPLAARARPDIQVVPAGSLVAADCQVAAGDLAGLLSQGGLGLFTGRPWLRADEAAVAAWRQRLDDFAPRHLRVGFCWRSGLLSAGRADMYSRLTDWAPLFAMPGICWVPLQYDLADPATAAELAAAGQRFATPAALDTALDLRDDQDGVAALMGALDLVISAGTAVSELAGALGVPVWRFGSSDDWTMLGTAVRPWYGSMRLFPSPPGRPAADALPAIAGALAALTGSVPPPPGTLQRAADLHQAGDRAVAIALYRSVLAHDPGDPVALHLLGYALAQEGGMGEGLALMERAVAARPDYVAARVNLANMLRQAGRAAEAVPHYQAALDVRSDGVGIRVNLALALRESGQAAAARTLLRGLLAEKMDSALAWDALGLVRGDLDDHTGAIAAHREAVRLQPDLLAGWVNLAAALKLLFRFGEAVTALNRALAIDPGNLPARASLGVCLARTGATDKAIALLRSVATEHPDFAAAAIDLAQLYNDQFLRADALAVLDRLLDARPQERLARANRSRLDLERGRLDRGWQDNAARFVTLRDERTLSIPPWRGEDPAGQRILVWAEQGIGDQILFASLLPDLAARGAELVVECEARLMGLFARSLPGALVRAATDNPTDADMHCAMGDLPRWLRPDLGAFTTGKGAWLVPDQDQAALWRDRLAVLPPGLRVGFCWRSGLINPGRAPAYLALPDLLPILRLPGIVPICLQYGDVTDELDQLEQQHGIRLHRWDDLDLKQDLEGGAALTAGLDLVISAATSVGEMAGALGVPVWRFQPRLDWGVLGTGVRPWFASMRLFAHRAAGTAVDLVEPMRQTLLHLLRGDPPAPPSLEECIAAQRAGDLARAEAGYRAVLAAQPGEPDAAHLLALTLLQAGRAAEALPFVDQALAGDADFANAHNSRGSILKTLDRLGEAEAAFRRALALRPDQAEAWANLGATLTMQHRPAEGIKALRQALAMRPDYPRALASLGTALRATGEVGAGVAACRQALALDPALADAWSDLGLGLAREGDMQGGIDCQEKALAADPTYAEAAVNLATLLAGVGQSMEARGAAAKALSIRADYPRARYSLGLLELAAGELSPGWVGHEARFTCGEVGGLTQTGLPVWQGEALAGRRLLIQREQGLGDEIMFASLFGLLCDRGGPVTVEADPRLLPLLARQWPGLQFVTSGLAGDHDLRLPAGSLPGLLAPDYAGWDWVAFLAPKAELVARWRDRLAVLPPGLRVGLCWRSQLREGDRAGGYTTLCDWLPLFRLPGVQVINLQYDDATREIDQLAADHGVRPHGWADLDLKNDLEGLAALMAGLDLVISAPTAVGEMAGALGVPVWRLSDRSDWSRLGTGARPWFATMNIATVPLRTQAMAQVPAVVARLAALAGGGALPDPAVSLQEGIARQSAGDPAGAMAHYRAVLGQRPDHPVALHLLGLAHHQQGQHAKGLPFIERALALAPDYAAAWANLGNLYQALDNPAAAEAAYRRALALRPDAAETWTNLGNALRLLRRPADALAAHDRAVSLRPDWAVGHANRAMVAKQLDRLGDAASSFQRALDLGGDRALNSAGLADVLRQAGNLPAAEQALHRAAVLTPGDGEIWNQCGQLAEAMGDKAGALHHYNRALALDPGLESARHNRGLLALAGGDLTTGWDGYASRYRADAVVRGRDCDIPTWQGEALAGRRLLVWGEQGLGDHLLFAALYPALASLGAGVVLETDPRLVGLFTRSFPWATVRATRSGPMQADCQIAAGDLGGLLWWRLGDVAPGPYLRPEPSRLADWSRRLAALGPGLKVGVCWRSSRITAARGTSYLGLAALAPLARLPWVTLINLQMGLDAGEQASDLPLHRFDDLDLKDDLEGQAALIATLDLVITAPTAVGEMAGAVGTPVWRLTGADWTSLGTGVRPWFPAMRLLGGTAAGIATAAGLLSRQGQRQE
jgi:tetratricopeptide (TPR) repeat protein/ADP-heptose:LPS heptosyltransferase